MTADNKILISPQEIVSLGCECPQCGVLYLVPIGKLTRVAIACPNCKEPWADEIPAQSGVQNSDANVLRHFVESLKMLQQKKVGAFLRLEIKDDTKFADKQGVK
jgi:hypothetical protein